jgi:hypothetical protein
MEPVRLVAPRLQYARRRSLAGLRRLDPESRVDERRRSCVCCRKSKAIPERSVWSTPGFCTRRSEADSLQHRPSGEEGGRSAREKTSNPRRQSSIGRRRPDHRCARSFTRSGDSRLRPCPRRRPRQKSRSSVSRRVERDGLANCGAWRCQNAGGVWLKSRRSGGSYRAKYRTLLLYSRRGGLVGVWCTIRLRQGTLCPLERYRAGPPGSMGSQPAPAAGCRASRKQRRNCWGMHGMHAHPWRRLALLFASYRAWKCRPDAKCNRSGTLRLFRPANCRFRVPPSFLRCYPANSFRGRDIRQSIASTFGASSKIPASKDCCTQ